MRASRALGPIAFIAIAIVAAGCYEQVSGEQALRVTSTSEESGAIPTATPILDLPAPVILSVETPTPAPDEPTSEAPSQTPGRDPVGDATELEPAETSTPAPEPTTEPTASPSAAPTAAPPSDDADGFPFRSSDLAAAIATRGLDYEPGEARPGCDGNAAEVRHLDSSDGPPLSLWVYATPEDLKADWVLPSSGAASPRFGGCELDGGWIYWHENLILAFEPQAEWISEGAVREQIVAALWSLTR